MAYQTAAKAYRDNEVYAASPAQLLIITFDYLISQMTRTRIGMETKQLEVILSGLDRSRVAVGELLATIDPADQSDLARTLRSLFAFTFSELIDLGRSHDQVRLEHNLANIRELRTAFATAAQQAQAEVA